MNDNSQNIKKNQSAVRKMISQSDNSQYKALGSLREAKEIKNSYIIMEGDDGGQIYLVCPVEEALCDEGTLQNLLKELDEKIWNDITMAHLLYEVHKPDSTIEGGMGGGVAGKNLWVHKDLENLKDRISKVLKAEITSLNN